MLPPKAAVVWLAVTSGACTLALGFDEVSSGELSPSAAFRCSALVPEPWFCDDFDGDGEPFAAWSRLEQSNGTASLNDEQYVSAGRSFKATTVSFPLGSEDISAYCAAELFIADLRDKPMLMTVSFQFMMESFDSSSDALVTPLSFAYLRDDGANFLDLDLVPTSGNALAFGERIAPELPAPDDSAYLHGLVSGNPLQVGRWYHVELTFDIREPTGTDNLFSLVVDDQARKTAKFNFPLAGGTPELALGVTSISSSTIDPYTLRFDNFVVEVDER
jgi:hypothetical protein